MHEQTATASCKHNHSIMETQCKHGVDSILQEQMATASCKHIHSIASKWLLTACLELLQQQQQQQQQGAPLNGRPPS
jgi:hypothetical protein